MEVKGKINQILEMESGTGKNGKAWNKQSIVIDNGDNYNPLVCISFFGDKSDLLQKFKVGQEVTIGINLSSREFNGKWYHNIDGWKINPSGEIPQPEMAEQQDGDLPF